MSSKFQVGSKIKLNPDICLSDKDRSATGVVKDVSSRGYFIEWADGVAGDWYRDAELVFDNQPN